MAAEDTNRPLERLAQSAENRKTMATEAAGACGREWEGEPDTRSGKPSAVWSARSGQSRTYDQDHQPGNACDEGEAAGG